MKWLLFRFRRLWGRQRNIYLRMVISCHSSSLRIANSACCLHGMLQQWSERCSEAFTTVPAHRLYSVNVGCYYNFLTSFSGAMWIFSWLFKFSACFPLLKTVILILVWYNKKLYGWAWGRHIGMHTYSSWDFSYAGGK